MITNAASQAPLPVSTTREEQPVEKRIQVILGPKAKRRLEYYKERIEPSTYTEVLRTSLMLFDDIMKHLDAGDEFLVKDGKGNVYPYKPLIDI